MSAALPRPAPRSKAGAAEETGSGKPSPEMVAAKLLEARAAAAAVLADAEIAAGVVQRKEEIARLATRAR